MPVSFLVIRPDALIEFEYTNHCGEVENRQVLFKGVDYGHNQFYPTPQYFLRCFCLDRRAERSFAINNITAGSLRDVVTTVRLLKPAPLPPRSHDLPPGDPET